MSNSGSDNEATTYEEILHREFAEEHRRKREDDEIINGYLTVLRMERNDDIANGTIHIAGRGVIDRRRLIRERDGKDDSHYTVIHHRVSCEQSLREQERNDFKFDKSIAAFVAEKLRNIKEGDYDTDVDYEDEYFEEMDEDEEEEDDDQD